MKKILVLVGFLILEFALYPISIDIATTFTLLGLLVFPISLALLALEIFPRRLFPAAPISIGAFVITNMIHLILLNAAVCAFMPPGKGSEPNLTLEFFDFAFWYVGGLILICFWIGWLLLRTHKK